MKVLGPAIVAWAQTCRDLIKTKRVPTQWPDGSFTRFSDSQLTPTMIRNLILWEKKAQAFITRHPEVTSGQVDSDSELEPELDDPNLPKIPDDLQGLFSTSIMNDISGASSGVEKVERPADLLLIKSRLAEFFAKFLAEGELVIDWHNLTQIMTDVFVRLGGDSRKRLC